MCVFGPLFFCTYGGQFFSIFILTTKKKGKDGKIGLSALGNAAKVSPHTYACGYVRQFFSWPNQILNIVGNHCS